MGRIFQQSKEVRRIWSGFQSARVLITANNYRVFDYLEDKKTARKLAKEIGTDSRATEILLDALVGLGLIKKHEEKYKNSNLASRFLISKSRYYQGDIIRHVDGLWNRWSELDKILKTGKPSQGSRNHKAFILGMHNIAVLQAKKVVNRVDLKGVRKVLDLGGGPGTYAMEMARRGVHVTLFDTPETIKIAKRVINSKFKIQNSKINFISGDFFIDDIGKGYDLIFMSYVLHAYSEKKNIEIFRKCKKALNSCGKAVVHEFFIHENRAHPVESSLFAINMLVNTEGGRTYSPGKICEWFLKTGFKNIRKKLVADGVLVSARK